MKLFSKRGVQFRLVFTLGLMLVFLISGFLAVSYRDQNRRMVSESIRLLDNTALQLTDTIRLSAAQAYALAEWIANMPDVQKAFAQRNRDKLKELTLPIYLAVKQKANIDQFQFHTPPATSFLRLHLLEKFGDDLTAIRPGVVQANAQKKPVVGMDSGVAGIGIRGVTPMFCENQHIGTVEIGGALNDVFLKSFKETYGMDVSVIVRKKEGFSHLASTHKTEIPPDFHPLLDQVMKTGASLYHRPRIDGRTHITWLAPLKDFTGKTEGVIAIPRDMSPDLMRIRALLLQYLGMGVVLIGVFLLVMYGIIQRVLYRPMDRIVGSLSDGSAQVAAASGEISAASQSLAINASEQTGRMEESTHALTRMSDNLKNSSELTAGAEALMQQNIQKTVESLKAIVNLTQGMSQIEDDSEKIRQIVKAIQEIAFQTNLLALNAAVEAARAGEAGAGFGVVAEEVKKLASRSGQAARDTQELLEATITRVVHSVKAIQDVNSNFEDIVKSATVMGEKTQAITLSTKEQAGVMDSLGEAGKEIESITQSVAANAQQTASAAEELAAQAKWLDGIVGDLIVLLNGKSGRPAGSAAE